MKRINLSRLQPKFIQQIKKYMADNDLSQGDLAREVQLQRTHLNMLLNGGRNLTAYYLFKFIMKGVIKVSDVYDGKPEGVREQEFWETAGEAENIATLKRIARLRKKGVNVDALLDAMDPTGKAENNKNNPK